ncbi:hypothetical protein [Nocardia sp. IFM 10818]
MATNPDNPDQIEIQVIRDVIDAAEAVLQHLEITGSSSIVSRPDAYAIFIHAVIASARSTGYYGPGSLIHAPLLDAIFTGTDATPWDTTTFAALVQRIAHD